MDIAFWLTVLYVMAPIGVILGALRLPPGLWVSPDMDSLWVRSFFGLTIAVMAWVVMLVIFIAVSLFVLAFGR